MERKTNLAELKKEFFEEISKINIGIDDIKNAKVSKEVLQTEIALRRVFGDEIFEKQKIEDRVDGEKEIIKLSEEDIAFDSEVQRLTDDLVDAEFETGVNVLLSKISEQEEE